MDDHASLRPTGDAEAGRLGRRAFIEAMAGLGLTAPVAAGLLASAGAARAQSPAPLFTPARRGGGGEVRVLMWQAPTGLTPHFAAGLKDAEAARIFYEPLASYEPDGKLVPVLAEEVPGPDNGGLSRDGLTVTWRLKKNVVWHDEAPFTADDVVFNWELATDPASASVVAGPYREAARVEAGTEPRSQRSLACRSWRRPPEQVLREGREEQNHQHQSIDEGLPSPRIPPSLKGILARHGPPEFPPNRDDRQDDAYGQRGLHDHGVGLSGWSTTTDSSDSRPLR